MFLLPSTVFATAYFWGFKCVCSSSGDKNSCSICEFDPESAASFAAVVREYRQLKLSWTMWSKTTCRLDVLADNQKLLLQTSESETQNLTFMINHHCNIEESFLPYHDPRVCKPHVSSMIQWLVASCVSQSHHNFSQTGQDFVNA